MQFFSWINLSDYFRNTKLGKNIKLEIRSIVSLYLITIVQGQCSSKTVSYLGLSLSNVDEAIKAIHVTSVSPKICSGVQY